MMRLSVWDFHWNCDLYLLLQFRQASIKSDSNGNDELFYARRATEIEKLVETRACNEGKLMMEDFLLHFQLSRQAKIDYCRHDIRP